MIGESLAYIIIFWAPAKAALAKTANSGNAVVSAKNQVIFSSILEMFTNALKVFSNTTIVQGGILDYNYRYNYSPKLTVRKGPYELSSNSFRPSFTSSIFSSFISKSSIAT